MKERIMADDNAIVVSYAYDMCVEVEIYYVW